MVNSEKRKTVNIAIIGSGAIGCEHAKGYALASVACPDMAAVPVLKVLCDMNEERVRERARDWGFEEYCTDYHELLERDDIDVVDICTTTFTHLDLCIDFIKAKKFFVVCEKPLVPSIEDMEKLAAIIKECNWDSRTAVAFNKRRFQAVSYARDVIKSGILGDIVVCYFRYHSGGPNEFKMPPTYADWKKSGGWADCGSHLVDMCRFILDDQYDEVVAQVGPALKTVYDHRPAEGEALEDIPKVENTYESYALVMGKMKSGVLVTLAESQSYLGAHEDISYEICGSKGTLRWSSKNINVVQRCLVDDNRQIIDFKNIDMGRMHPYGNCVNFGGFARGVTDSMAYEAYDIINACVNGTEFQPTILKSQEVVKVCCLARESEKTHSWLKVE